MQTLAKPWPMPAMARARPRMRTNQREIETLTTMEPINESPGLISSQRTSMNWMKSLRLTEADKAGAGNQTARRHQPAPAVAVHQRADHRRRRSADENLAGTDQRKRAAGNAEIGGQRFEKYAQRAGDRKCRGDVGEKADDDDDPAVIERLSLCRLLEQRRNGHP